MTCWKTINLSKDYGFHRIVLVSCISMLLAFIFFYLPMNLMYSPVELHQDGVSYFFIGILLIVPVHELLHAIPLWAIGKRVKINIRRIYSIIPIVSARSRYSLSKNIIILVLLTPFLFITVTMLITCMLFPGYIHYFTMIAALNFGLCVKDFIYLKLFINAPKKCLVEEIEDGYDILVTND